MPIDLGSCPAHEAIVVTTRGSVYELIVLRGDWGDVLVRGGRYVTDFQRALFLGSAATGDAVKPRIIDIGLRMTFVVDDRFIITSPVESISRCPATAASVECAVGMGAPLGK